MARLFLDTDWWSVIWYWRTMVFLEHHNYPLIHKPNINDEVPGTTPRQQYLENRVELTQTSSLLWPSRRPERSARAVAASRRMSLSVDWKYMWQQTWMTVIQSSLKGKKSMTGQGERGLLRQQKDPVRCRRQQHPSKQCADQLSAYHWDMLIV